MGGNEKLMFGFGFEPKRNINFSVPPKPMKLNQLYTHFPFIETKMIAAPLF